MISSHLRKNICIFPINPALINNNFSDPKNHCKIKHRNEKKMPSSPVHPAVHVGRSYGI